MSDRNNDYDAALELAAECNRTIDAAKFLRDEMGLTLLEAVSATARAAEKFPQSPLAIARRVGG